MAYTKVQYIGLRIRTAIHETAAPGGGTTSKYLGDAAAGADLQARTQIMNEMILSAYQAQGANGAKLVDTSSMTLKVFVAPEFFFRPAGGAYPFELAGTVMSQVRKQVSSSSFTDWIFVLGTTIAFIAQEDGTKEILNLAMITKGGSNTPTVLGVAQKAPPTQFVIYKEFTSRVDFHGPDTLKKAMVGGVQSAIKNVQGAREDVFGNAAKGANAGGYDKELNTSGLGGGSIFQIGDILFGLEICMDHEQGRLRNAPPPHGKPYVQIHLLTAAGLISEEAKTACARGGHLVHVDGAAGGDALVWAGLNERTWTSPKLKALDLPTKVDPKLKTPAATYAKYFAQPAKIWIYPAVAIPPKVNAPN